MEIRSQTAVTVTADIEPVDAVNAWDLYESGPYKKNHCNQGSPRLDTIYIEKERNSCENTSNQETLTS